MTDTDCELLRAYTSSRSEAAFAELVERHLNLVHGTATRVAGGDAHAAADISQQVFSELARRARDLPATVILPAWLYTITHHMAVDFVRSEQRRRAREQEAHAMENATASDSSTIDWDRVRPLLDSAMVELPAADRDAIVLRYFSGRPFREIGQALRLTEDAARMRVDRALDRLQARLGRHGITSTAAALSLALAENALGAAPAGLASAITTSAVASTAGSAAIAGGAIILMKTTTTVAVGVAALALALVGYEYTELAVTRESLQAVTTERDDARKAQREATQKLEAQAKTMAARAAAASERNLMANRPPQSSPSLSAASAAAPNVAPPPKVVQTVGLAISGGAMMFGRENSEELREKLRQANAATIDRIYGPLLDQLGWTDDQRAQFKAMKLDSDERAQKLFQEAAKAERAKNPNVDRAAIQDIADATFSLARQDFITALRTNFGDAAAEAFDRYRSPLPGVVGLSR